MSKLDIDEISLVDSPANEEPFFFTKRGHVTVDKAEDVNLSLEFSTEGSPDSTALKVNGAEIEAPAMLQLDYWPNGDRVAVGCTYAVRDEGEADGFTETKTYSLYKSGWAETVEESKDADRKDLEKVRSLVPDAGEDMDGTLCEALAGQVDAIVPYLDDCPREFQDAVRSVLKIATCTKVEDEEDEEIDEMTKSDTTNEGGGKGSEGQQTSEPQAQAPSIDLDDLVGRITEKVKPMIEESVSAAVASSSPKPESPDDNQGNQEGSGNQPDSADEEVSPEEAARLIAEATAEAAESESNTGENT